MKYHLYRAENSLKVHTIIRENQELRKAVDDAIFSNNLSFKMLP